VSDKVIRILEQTLGHPPGFPLYQGEISSDGSNAEPSMKKFAILLVTSVRGGYIKNSFPSVADDVVHPGHWAIRIDVRFPFE
jgi:hypothetical protein